jgi:hypothetical protein
MAGSKSDALEARILDHLFEGGATPALTALATVYVAMMTVVPSDSSAGTEVTGSSYARQAATSAVWSRTGSVITSTADVNFPAVTGSPYTVVGWGLYDAPTGGNFLYWGDTTSTVMNVGDIPRFAAGTITVTED